MIHRHRQEDVDVPSFLHNSPYFPVFDPKDYDDKPIRQRPRPTPLQILKSKPSRTTFSVVIIFLLFFLLKSHLQKYDLFTRLSGPRCYFKEPVTIPTYYVDEVDWARYAYVMYATNIDYLCNTLMLFESLHRFGSRAERVLMFPEEWVKIHDSRVEVEGRLLKKAEEMYNVTLKPVQVLHQNLADMAGPNWASSYTKLLAFNLTQYDRLLHLDSDSTLLSDLDELFMLPSTSPVYLPRAYWLPNPTLSSHIMLLTPSQPTFSLIRKTYEEKSRVGYYDMEVVNDLFGSTCSILPHKVYALLSGILRFQGGQGVYLDAGLGGSKKKKKGAKKEEWDPRKVIEEAKFVHFSDFPLPKPWLASSDEIDKLKPDCISKGRKKDCSAREIWLDLYEDFRSRRKSVCEL